MHCLWESCRSLLTRLASTRVNRLINTISLQPLWAPRYLGSITSGPSHFPFPPPKRGLNSVLSEDRFEDWAPYRLCWHLRD